MRFSELSQYLEKLEKTASRNDITKILGDVLSRSSEEEVDKLCYLLLGELVPAYRGIEFQIAEKMMIQILALAYGKPPLEAARAYREAGDLGDSAYALASRRRGAARPLSVGEVYRRLMAIAVESGEGSQERKIAATAALLADLDRLSAKFVARIPVGKLRLGFSDATVLDALSLMAAGDKSARKEIEHAYSITADIGLIAVRLKKGGLASLRRIEVSPGTPIRASLAERLSNIEEVIAKAGPEVGVEPKLDGLRMQIHMWEERGEKRAALFSRNLENTTRMFPEIARAAEKLRARSVVLDGEAIGYNPATGTFAPFQETIQRKRKHDIEEFAKKIPLSIFVFDVLYWNGKSLLGLPFRERRRLLERIFPASRRRDAIRLTAFQTASDSALIARELQKSVAAGLEGLVVKNLALPYEPGSRGFHWIKLKATTAALGKLRAGAAPGLPSSAIGGLPDTVDCVVMGAYRGRGKRTQFGVGGFLLGVRGKGDRYYTISRLGTGLSDADFREAYRRLRPLEAGEAPPQYAVEKESAPDMWVRPALVVEILADEITRSPRHTAGKKKDGRGYSLRFPRLVRIRDDKKPEDATTVEEVERMYRMQNK